MRPKGSGRDGAKERLWRAAVSRQAASGSTIRDFCRREGLSEPSFYAWKRLIAERDRERNQKPTRPQQTRRIARRKPRAVYQRPAFLPVSVITGAGSADLKISTPRGWRVRVPAGFDATTLAEVLRLLDASDPATVDNAVENG